MKKQVICLWMAAILSLSGAPMTALAEEGTSEAATESDSKSEIEGEKKAEAPIESVQTKRAVSRSQTAIEQFTIKMAGVENGGEVCILEEDYKAFSLTASADILRQEEETVSYAWTLTKDGVKENALNYLDAMDKKEVTFLAKATPGTYSITCTITIGDISDMAQTKILVRKDERTDLSAATMTLKQNSVTYSGIAQKPTVSSVRIGETKLQKTDYEISYTDADGKEIDKPKDAGKYTVWAKAKSDSTEYKGAAMAEYVIEQKDLSGLTVTVSGITTYTGKDQTSRLKLSGLGSVKKGDYTLTYWKDGEEVKSITDVGTYTVILAGRGNCYGTLQLPSFTMAPMPITIAATINSSTKVYDGTSDLAQQQRVTITGKNEEKTVKLQGKYEMQAAYNSSNVADADKIVVVVTLTDGNYILQDGGRIELAGSIKQAAPAGAPTVVPIAQAGKTLADIALGMGTLTPAGGKLEWVQAGTTCVEQGVAYKWRYTPVDMNNYAVLTGDIAVWTGGEAVSAPSSLTSVSLRHDLVDTALPSDYSAFSVTAEAYIAQAQAGTHPNRYHWYLNGEKEAAEGAVYSFAAGKPAGTYRLQCEAFYGGASRLSDELVFTIAANEGSQVKDGGDTTNQNNTSGGNTENKLGNTTIGANSGGKEENSNRKPADTTASNHSQNNSSFSNHATSPSRSHASNSDSKSASSEQNRAAEESASVREAVESNAVAVTQNAEKGLGVSISEAAILAAAENPVQIPLSAQAAEPTEIVFSLPTAEESVQVEILLVGATSSMIAVLLYPDGREEIAKTAVLTENGIVLRVSDGVRVKLLENQKAFVDARGHWAEDAIAFVAARGILSGVEETRFGVELPMTRGMFYTALARLAGVDTSGGRLWYEKGLLWAVENGISDGTNPTASLTREQLAAMLYRFAGAPAAEGVLDFADADAVSGYAKEALLWTVQNGILCGMDDGTLAPQGTVNRAQAAAIFARYVGSFLAET